jgi:hypothetical protein
VSSSRRRTKTCPPANDRVDRAYGFQP